MHTPGPWSERSRDGCAATIQGASGEILCSVNMLHERTDCEANARLITAAPNMYDALQKALKALESYPPSIHFSKVAAGTVRAALARAEGNAL